MSTEGDSLTGSLVDELRDGFARARPPAELPGLASDARLVIGRGDPSATDLVVDHRYVSRRHAGIMTIDGVPVVVDLESRNGTWVRRDGVRHAVRELVILAAGDHIETLDSIELAVMSR